MIDNHENDSENDNDYDDFVMKKEDIEIMYIEPLLPVFWEDLPLLLKHYNSYQRVFNFLRDLHNLRKGKCPHIHGFGPIMFSGQKTVSDDKNDLLPDGFKWMLRNPNYHITKNDYFELRFTLNGENGESQR